MTNETPVAAAPAPGETAVEFSPPTETPSAPAQAPEPGEVTVTPAPVTAELLAQPARSVNAVVSELQDVEALLGLRSAERGGKDRNTVVAAMDNRIGMLVAESAATKHDDRMVPYMKGDRQNDQYVNEAMEMLSRAGVTETTTEDLLKLTEGEVEGAHAVQSGTVTHERPRTLFMHHLTAAGWRPIPVAATNIPMLLRNGYKALCPDCGRDKCGVVGRDPGGRTIYDPNDCTGRDPIAFARCPVCARPIYDPGEVTMDGDEGGDVNELLTLFAGATTPEHRLKVLVGDHLSVVHRSEARMLGLNVASVLDPPAITPPLTPDSKGAQ